MELAFLLFMVAGSFGDARSMSFVPEDFSDNVRERSNISLNEKEVAFKYDPELVVLNDEGVVLGDDLLTGKFALGSGAYVLSVDYKADDANGYAELYSNKALTEPFSEKADFIPDREKASVKVYVPFARSLHDIQMNIHYTGPGSLTVYAINLTEDVSYRWVPIAGYLLLFGLLDLILWSVFAVSGAGFRSYIRKHYEIPLLFGVVFLASLPDMTDFIYMGHDMRFHLARLMAVAHEISYGQFPVRMLTDMLKGYGYPTSIFYCDLFMYPFSLFYLLGLPLRMCWQTYVLTSNIITTLLSYFAFRRIAGDRGAAVTGTAIYVLSAYRIVDIYLRSAMGEFTALTFIPLVILGIWIIYYEEKESLEGWLYLGLGMSAVALCHLLSVEMITLFLVIFCLLEYRRTFTVYRLLSIAKAAMLTVFLSAWFIFPMLFSMRSISLSMYEHQHFIQAHGAYPVQIFNMFMRGTGVSAAGIHKEMPLSLGGGMIIALAMLLYVILKRDVTGDRKRQRIALVLSGVSLVFSMYFFPWDTIASITEGKLEALSRLARMVQFPWRFLEITTIVLGVTAAVILRELRKTEKKGILSEYKVWTGLLILGTVISLGAFYNPFVNEAVQGRAADESYMDDSIGLEEYLPEGSGRIIDLDHDVEIPKDSGAEAESYIAADGERRLTVSNAGAETSVLIPVFAYPGFKAEDVSTHEAIDIEPGSNARIKLLIPGGYEGTIRVYYREPFFWHVFEIISLVSALALISYLIYVRRKRNMS